MKMVAASSALFLIAGPTAALSQAGNLPSVLPTQMELRGGAAAASTGVQNPLYAIDEFSSEMPINQISKFAQSAVSENFAATRSVRGAEVYRKISPAVALIATKEGFGSGSLLDHAGNIITNWHVVKGFEYVAVLFKPTVEGKEPTSDEMRRGAVVKHDAIADLALVKVSEVPAGRGQIRLGDSSQIAVGMDVHAIGHPTGETWTYTTGVISQYRQGYEWQAAGDPINHRADIIQTQTPINLGNSGGPLLSDSGALIGVNSFKADGEGLNFAVSVDEVRKFIARPGSRIAQTAQTNKDKGCEPRELSKFRDAKDVATVTSFDFFCTGKDTGELVTPDDKAQAIFLRLDRNGDGRADVMIFDLKRQGRWDLSLWDDKFDGHWTLVGYHDDGSLNPSRFESYSEFQKRAANR